MIHPIESGARLAVIFPTEKTTMNLAPFPFLDVVNRPIRAFFLEVTFV